MLGEEPHGDVSDGDHRNVLPPGYRLDEYVIEGCIGSGGFGITYRGRDSNLDKAVAIKEYFPFEIAFRAENSLVSPRTQVQRDLDDYEWGLQRVVEEARTLAMFEHPNVIRVIRYLKCNGTAYIVMEFARGQELAEIVKKRGRLTESEVQGILTPLLNGLEAVHAAGMLHRDIKPGNIIIREDGSPMLIDFGAARQAIGARSKSLSAIVTPGYAPIEQYSTRGEQGPWTDIYALGAVAYTCLTGGPPDDASERIEEDRTAPLAKALRGHGASAFFEAIDWAIAPYRRDRPQSIAEWRDALSGASQAQRAAPATIKVKDRKPAPGGAARESAVGVRRLMTWGVAAISAVVALGAIFLALQLNGGTKQMRTVTVEKRDPVDEPPNVREPESVPDPRSPPENDRTLKADRETFAAAQGIGTSEAYQIYLQLYPSGAHASEAEAAIRRLGASPAPGRPRL